MAVAQYEHSRAFDSLKRIKENISGNYTSLQYLQTLNHFLWKALEPVARECPSLFKGYLCKVVARQTLKASAKFTSNERHQLPVQLFNMLIAQEDKVVERARDMHINRGILFGFISFFQNHLIEYRVLHQKAEPGVITRSLCWRIERSLGLREGGDLYTALMEVEYWAAKARKWKEQIMEKYTRMAILQAKTTYTDYNHVVKLDDVVQIYLLVVSKAIDRCDSRHGVITTFMQNWFKSARGEVARLAAEQQDASYEGLIEEHGDAIHDVLGTSSPDMASDMWQHVSFVAKQIDPLGLIRTKMGIPQHVCLKHRLLLETFIDE